MNLLRLFHRLISVIILSRKVPSTGRVRIESVERRTPKTPPSANDAPPLYLPTLNVLSHGAWA
jgi:hypothetical protein